MTEVSSAPLQFDYTSKRGNYNPSTGVFTLPGVGAVTGSQNAGCVIYEFQFHTSAHTRILSPSIAGTGKFDFYIMNSTDFEKWNWSFCFAAPIQGGALGVTSYNLDWSAPSDGTYYFLFGNRGYFNVQISGFLPVTLVSTVKMQTTRSTTTIRQTIEIPFLQANASWLLPLVIVIVVAVMLFIKWPRKGHRKRRRS